MSATTHRILIVEDDEDLGPNWVDLFRGPPEEYRRYAGDDCFEVDLATNKADAAAFLSQAAEEFRAYDVVLLDLQIPTSATRRQPEMRNGIDVFNIAMEEKRCTQVVVASRYVDLKNLEHYRQALEAGRADFLNKFDVDHETMFLSILGALTKGRLKLQTQWAQWLRDRIEHWRLVQSRAQIADGMSQIVSDGVGRMREHGRALSKLFEARYDLRSERDADDPLCRTVQRLTDDAERILSRCISVRRELDDGKLTEDCAQPVVIEEIVRERVELSRSGLALKRLSLNRLPQGSHVAQVFRHDLEMLLDELISNAIEASNLGQTLSIEIDERIEIDEANGNYSERTIEIRVTDQAPSIKESDRRSIAANRPVDVKEGRGWGLSLAQRVAETSGSWIDVKPGSSEVGNTVTIHIPVAP
jgi:signal transduction histidine kinase